MAVERISEHVWWMPPGPPNRPSLCAVVGERWTLAGVPERPAAIAYTHSHWDHVFGGIEVEGVVIAHTLTARRLDELAGVDWTDEANVSDTIRQELPAPRLVEIAPADIVFTERIDLDLGGVRVSVEHVGGDHCEDACVMLVEPDALLFLGDCLCASPAEKLTVERALPLYDRILSYPAERYVEGHHPAVTTRAEVWELISKARAAASGDATPGDDDAEYFLNAFVHLRP